MREATCAGTQTSKAPTLSGPSVTIIILCYCFSLCISNVCLVETVGIKTSTDSDRISEDIFPIHKQAV